MADGNVLKLRLSLMGRPVRNYTFDKNVISIGRDPNADVFVDNPGISRDHFRLEKTPTGDYQVVDLGSANGTYVNDQMVNTSVVRNNDVVRFGKYTLWVGYEGDRRAAAAAAHEARRTGADASQHTMILSRAELGNLLDVAREKEQAAPAAAAVGMPNPVPVAGKSARTAKRSPVGALLTGFLLGALLGAGGMWLLLHR